MRPLAVLGHYEVTSGGCDTIRASDGGIPEILAHAAEYATAGHDVILEGLRLSSEVTRSAGLARQHHLHILQLSTPPDQCVRNLMARRHAGKAALSSFQRTAAVEHESVEAACRRLTAHAVVQVLSFEAALLRARVLLGVGTSRSAA
jgi:hypothetical protein